MLMDAMTRLIQEHLDETAIRVGRQEWLAAAWAAVEEMGLPLALVPEDNGGFGIAPGDALTLVRLAGAHAVPLPIGETMMANAALAAAGLPLAVGPAALIPASADIKLVEDRLTGTARRVAWGGEARTLAIEVDGDRLVRLSEGWQIASRSRNLAHHSRDDLVIDAVVSPVTRAGPPLIARGGAVRALQIAGALTRALELTIDHVNERSQFGRTLAKFQAIQHEAARAAGDIAAADASAGLASEAMGRSTDESLLAVAAARIRGGEAVSVVMAVAHQLHGAMGFTAEHSLHLLSTACWSWRDEFGAQPWWNRQLGRAAIAAGGAGLWPFITAA